MNMEYNEKKQKQKNSFSLMEKYFFQLTTCFFSLFKTPQSNNDLKHTTKSHLNMFFYFTLLLKGKYKFPPLTSSPIYLHIHLLNSEIFFAFSLLNLHH